MKSKQLELNNTYQKLLEVVLQRKKRKIIQETARHNKKSWQANKSVKIIPRTLNVTVNTYKKSGSKTPWLSQHWGLGKVRK